MAKKKTPEPRPVGRPTEYLPEYCDLIIKYFSEPPYKETTNSMGTTKQVATDFKSFAGFAVSIRTHRGTLNDWCKLHPEFADAYKIAKEMQENWLVVNGNKGLINPAFGMFTAKNVTDMRDKREIEINKDKAVEKLSDEELDKEIQRRLGESK